jgi:hypothetical protein
MLHQKSTTMIENDETAKRTLNEYEDQTEDSNQDFELKLGYFVR